MSDQMLQEAWSFFAQTEPGNVLERQKRLDNFLDLLLSYENEAPLSNLLHFSDLSSVVSLLGGQFLADVEHICLGSVSYDSDTSSNATSLSVRSIVSNVSQASDGSRGCRPRVANNTGTTLGHHITFPPHLPHLVEEHLFPGSDHNFETQEHVFEVYPSLDKEGSKTFVSDSCQKTKSFYDSCDIESHVQDQPFLDISCKLNAKRDTIEKGGHKSTHPETEVEQSRHVRSLFISTSTETGKVPGGGNDTEGKESTISVCESSWNQEGFNDNLQDHTNTSKDKNNDEGTDLQIKHCETGKNNIEGTGAEHEVYQLGEAPQASQPLKSQSEECQERSTNGGGSSSMGKEAQNAAVLTHYLQKGCGAKILVVLDQLGVVGLTGGKEISRVLSFIFTFILRNSLLSNEPKATLLRSESSQRQLVTGGKKDSDVHEMEKLPSNMLPPFKYVPAINLSLQDIFAPVIHLANSQRKSIGRSSSLSTLQPWAQTSLSKSSSLSSCQSLKKVGKRVKRRRRKRHSLSVPFVPSDTEGEDNQKLSRLDKTLVQFTRNPNDFDYFTQVVYSGEERQPDPLSSENVASPKGQIPLNEHPLTLSLAELLQCIISIQIQLTMIEAEQKHLSSPLLATQDILQYSLDTFTTMVIELKHKREHTQGMQLLLTWMLKLVFSSLQSVLKSSEMLHSVTDLGIIPKLIKLVCNLLEFKLDSSLSSTVQSDCRETYTDIGSQQQDAGKEELAHDIMIGLLFLLQSITRFKLEGKEVFQCLHLHITFLQHDASEIIKKIVLESKSLPLNKRMEILDSVSDLVIHMKYWREDIYHSEICDKRSHRFCEYRTVQNHHSRVFGINANNINIIHSGRCLISVFCDILLECFGSGRNAQVSVFALKALSKCGLCCCMSAEAVLSILFKDVTERMTYLPFVTYFIENIVWRDLSGLADPDPVKCCFCQKFKSDIGSSFPKEYTSDESFMSRDMETSEGVKAEINTRPYMFWKGVGVYVNLLFKSEIASKMTNHIVRLVSQSNMDIKEAMCEYLIIPVLKKICDVSVADYIAKNGNEKEIITILIKCLRLTLMESNEVKLMNFLTAYGPALISDCKGVQGLRYEAFLLLCYAVKKELKLKPNFIVMGEMDQENEMVFSRLFEWEVIELDEFWSAYFGMKAKEVRKKFFIRTHQSMNNAEEHNDVAVCDENCVANYDCEKVSKKGVIDSSYSESVSSEGFTHFIESSVLTNSIELGVSAIGHHFEEADRELLHRPSDWKIDTATPEGDSSNFINSCALKKYENDGDPDNLAVSKKEEEQSSEVFRAERSAAETNIDTIFYEPEIPDQASGHLKSEESLTFQGTAIKSSSSSESFPSTYTASSKHSTPTKKCEAAEGMAKLKHQALLLTESADVVSVPSEERSKFVDDETLADRYTGLSELWQAVIEVLLASHEFQAFLASSSVRSLAAPMLVNITQDLARSSSGTLGISSIVGGQLMVTFSLMQSLLTFIIVTYPYTGLHVETLLNELRPPLLHYSPSTCGDVKLLVSVMLQCCILTSSSTFTYSLPHPLQHTELLEEDPGSTGDGMDGEAEETDGYEADTEQLANPSPSSSRLLNDEYDLGCPELVLLALDLIINHHEKYLESQEEAQQGAGGGPAHQGSYSDVRDQNEHQSQAAGTSSKHENHPNNFGLDDHSETERGTANYFDNKEHSNNDAAATEDHRGQTEEASTSMKSYKASKTSKRYNTSEKETKGKRSCAVDSLSSPSSLYHTLNSEDEVSSAGEQTSEWEDKECQHESSTEASRKTVVNKRSPQHCVHEGAPGEKHNEIDGSENMQTSHTVYQENTTSRSSLALGSRLCCESEVVHNASITQCVHTLLLLCRSSATICRRLQSLGLLSRLLDGFSAFISTNNEKYKDVVETVVAVWAEVGQWCLTSTELSQFFTLFKSSSAPLEVLLQALYKVLHNSGKEPHCALQYPCHVTATSTTSPTASASHSSLTESLASFVNIRAPTSPIVDAITRLHESHCRYGLVSSISVCAVGCPIPRSLDWSPYNSGLALTTWLCVWDRSGVDAKQLHSSQNSLALNCKSETFYETRAGRCTSRGATSSASVSSDLNSIKVHILSVGTQYLLFSLWLDPSNDVLQVCVSREVERESSQLSHALVVRAGLCDGAWHHLALCIPSINVRRGGNLKVTVFVDSMTCHPVSLNIPAVGSIKKSSPSYLLLGHTDFFSEETQPSCHFVNDFGAHGFYSTRKDSLPGSHHHQLLMGNVFLFREPILSRELCLYLMALGKDTTSLIPLTDKDERVILPPYITPKLLSAGMDLSVLYGHMDLVVRVAQNSLMMVHTTHCSSEYLCYKPHIPSLQDTGNQYPLCSSQPAVLFGELIHLNHHGPDVALLHTGGIAHIIFLFARMVELKSDEREQAAVLRLLVHCINSSPQLGAQFENMKGSSLIFRILRSHHTCPGVQLIKALVDGCTSPSVVNYVACRDVYAVVIHVPTLLTDRALLSSLLTNWRIFLDDFSKEQTTKYCVNEKGERLSIIGIILSVLKVLLAENQPYRDFNIAQLRDIDALDKILFMCEELELTTGSLDGICSADLLVTVIRGLLGASLPPSWRNTPSVTAQGLATQESLSSGFSSRSSVAGLPMNNLGLTSHSLGFPSLRVRDVAAVYRFLLLVHPAHLTYAATERHTAYYLPDIPISFTSSRRHNSSVAVGVDLAAELIDRPEKSQALQQFQAGDWQVIENSDPLMQLKRIRQQQQAEIRKLRREGSIARNAYFTSEDDDSPGEGHSSNTGTEDTSVFNSEDEVDASPLQHRIATSHVSSPRKAEECCNEDPRKERDTAETLFATNDQATEFNQDTYYQDSNQPLNEERTGDDNTLPRTTKWIDDTEEMRDENSEDEESFTPASLSCLTGLVVGLLAMLEEVLHFASDTTASTLLAEALHMDQTLIMANHPHPVIRCAVFKLFATIMVRCSPEDHVLHLHQNVPLIMGQQLLKHTTSVTAQLVMAAFSLALGQTFTFKNYTVDCDPMFAFPHKVILFIPLLAVLPNTAQDVALCHNTLMVLLDLLHKNSDLIIPLIHKAYFVDSLLCTLKRSLHTEGVGVSDLTGESECKLVVSDITEILSWIINCLVSSPQHKNFLLSVEVVHHLNLLCRGEAAVCGGQANCVVHLQGTESALLQVALSRIQATATITQNILNSNAANASVQFKLEKTSVTGSSSLHNMKLTSPATPREESDSGVGSVLANYTSIPFTKSLHNISDRLFLSQSRSTPALGLEGSRKDDTVLAHSELVERFKVLIQKATDFLFMSAWSSVESVACAVTSSLTPETFSLFLLDMLLSATATITQRKGNSERCGWERILWSCQDTLRLHLNHLLALVTSPRTHLETRVRAAQALLKQPKLYAIISCIAKANPQLIYKVGIFIHELRYQNESRLVATDIRTCETLLHVFEECSVPVLPPPEHFPPHGAMREWSVVSEEKKQWQDESAKIAILIVDRCTKQDERLITKNTQVYEAVAQECSRLTRSVVDRQNVERKFVLGGIKKAQCRHVHLTHRWRDLVETLTHERATWHFPHSYPRTWQLDQTEGPCRIRKRLSRGRLHINSRYLMTEYRQKIEVECQASPLEIVLQGSAVESQMAVMIERLNASERIVHMSRASVVSPGMEQCGEILVSHTSMYFVGEQVTTDMNQSGVSSEVVSVTWPLDTVREIHIRRYNLQDCALELFLTSGLSVLLAFTDTQDRNQVIGVLSMSDMPRLLNKTTLPEVTAQWREGYITNFEYLTQLNTLAGRSFNDLMQYPVFPFVLSNYTTDILSLNDPTNFRNLKKPIAVQHQEKEQHYINNYEITSQISQGATDGPYHYGSHYSNSGIVLHFLVRLPPFTQLFLRYQDGNFDIPDRTFHSLQTTWRLASADSTTDFKELIPEFFFLPEIFLNSEGFNMGVRQSGEQVHHVQLPSWSGGDPRRFVLVHRAALESPFVTQNLHHWIDLVFGYKQTGKAAVEAINVFHPATYFGYNVETGSDEISREARKAMIKTYGQTPQQLFTSPHPTASNTGPTQSPQAPEVLHEVRGLRWGTYAGSPADERPILALVQTLKTPASRLAILSHTEILLMPPHTHLLKTGQGKVSTSGVYILSSNYQDGIIRCRRLKDNMPQPLISVPSTEHVTWCVCGTNQVWLGLASGQILVHLVSTSHAGEELVLSLPPTLLLAHTAPISHMYLSNAFSVCISGGKDGMCILWDTNRLSYIRSIGWSGVEVSLLAMSETLGDWASITPLGTTASVLRLYTINGTLVDSTVTPAPVTALSFTSAPEGTAINVIATSMADGAIRLWSVWDLRAIRELKTDRARQPIASLQYTQDNLHLCGITESGILLVWESSLVKTKIPKFITIPPL